MPIKGMTTRDSLSPTSGLAKIATLRKGAEHGEEAIKARKAMKDLDYFRVDFEPEYKHLTGIFDEMYGKKPQLIPDVLLLGNTLETVFPTWMEEWSAPGLMHRCDGETQVQHFDPTQGKVSRECIACIAPKCGCKVRGRLYFMLPMFNMRTASIGYFALITGSQRDAQNISGELARIEHLMGSLVNIPFELLRKEEDQPVAKLDKEGKPTGERIKSKKWFVHIRTSESFNDQILLPRIAHNLQFGDGKSNWQEVAQDNARTMGQPHPQTQIPARAKSPKGNWATTNRVKGLLAQALDKKGLTEEDVERFIGFTVAEVDEWNMRFADATEAGKFLGRKADEEQQALEGEIVPEEPPIDYSGMPESEIPF